MKNTDKLRRVKILQYDNCKAVNMIISSILKSQFLLWLIDLLTALRLQLFLRTKNFLL